MRRVTRRRFLEVSGAGAAAAQTGGIAGLLATGRAPAYAQGTTLHWLRWNDFVPASDQLLKSKIAPQCEKDLGIKLNIEGIGANDLQARVTSAIQSGTGPDMILALSNWPQLYAESVVDVSDVVEEIGKDEGGLAWDDSSNNRAFLSGTCASTNNGASIYIEAKKKPDSYQTEKGTPLWQDTFHTRLPKGPAGQFIYPTPFTHMVMGYSKNQKAAKDVLRWASSKPIFGQWFTSQQGFCTGPT